MDPALTLSAREWRVLRELANLGGEACFGDLMVFLKLEAGIGICFSRWPKWPQRLLLRMRVTRIGTNVALAHLEDRKLVSEVKHANISGWLRRALPHSTVSRNSVTYVLTAKGRAVTDLDAIPT